MLIHIGYGRAGSTFLQKKIFTSFKNTTYIDLFKYKSFRINHFYNPILVNKKFKKKFDILSCENFTNSFFDINLMISKINSINKKAELLIILRDPLDHLISTYAYSVLKGNVWEKIDDIFSFKLTPYAWNLGKNGYFSITNYNYLELINSLKKNFNVHVFKYEEIFSNYSSIVAFQSKISSIIKKNCNKLKLKEFTKLNSRKDNFFIINKRIKNFKKQNNNIFKIINKKYFYEICSNNFKKKFLKKFKKINNNKFYYEK